VPVGEAHVPDGEAPECVLDDAPDWALEPEAQVPDGEAPD